ncbi:MAG: 1-(5-phosphoribosyl)-5-[(5-phosphoribosylamino)methylideneamino]imidazole-4-carboxamide isomerase [Ruminococcaceae bacterium]|nr:1-(5-phosphoribosyl)-5-[(5-phosphoribosylamino)methylideneamino]imidazole-4-carboxamide isomerase [Oscillospiraceae bacterium]
MYIFPAIDLYEGKAVRLFKGDYAQMTIYSENPAEIAKDFALAGARHLHLVDLEGAKYGTTPNLKIIEKILSHTGMFTEVGGGIRSMETVDTYLSAGVSRVILGTAAVNDPVFLEKAVQKHGEKIAVGVDIKDGMVAIKGWTEKSALDAFTFCHDLQKLGVTTIICTDISKDGAMMGANHSLYRRLMDELSMNIVASGGVSSLDDVKKLAAIHLYGAIIGKAYYTGAISIKEAIEVSK